MAVTITLRQVANLKNVSKPSIDQILKGIWKLLKCSGILNNEIVRLILELASLALELYQLALEIYAKVMKVIKIIKLAAKIAGAILNPAQRQEVVADIVADVTLKINQILAQIPIEISNFILDYPIEIPVGFECDF